MHQAVCLARHDAACQRARKLFSAPRGSVCKALRACRRSCAVANGRREAAERAVDHDERLRVGKRSVFFQRSIRVSLQNVLRFEVGAIIVRRRKQQLRRLASCDHRVLREAAHSQRNYQRERQKQRRNSFDAFHRKFLRFVLFLLCLLDAYTNRFVPPCLKKIQQKGDCNQPPFFYPSSNIASKTVAAQSPRPVLFSVFTRFVSSPNSGLVPLKTFFAIIFIV